MSWQDIALIVTTIFSVLGGISAYTNAFLIQRKWFKMYLQDKENENENI